MLVGKVFAVLLVLVLDVGVVGDFGVWTVFCEGDDTVDVVLVVFDDVANIARLQSFEQVLQTQYHALQHFV